MDCLYLTVYQQNVLGGRITLHGLSITPQEDPLAGGSQPEFASHLQTEQFVFLQLFEFLSGSQLPLRQPLLVTVPAAFIGAIETKPPLSIPASSRVRGVTASDTSSHFSSVFIN